MLKIPRTPGKSWSGLEQRQARIALVKFEIPRWSTRILEALWNLWEPPHLERHGMVGTRESQARQSWSQACGPVQPRTGHGAPHQQHSGHHILVADRSRQRALVQQTTTHFRTPRRPWVEWQAERTSQHPKPRPEQTQAKEATQAKYCSADPAIRLSFSSPPPSPLTPTLVSLRNARGDTQLTHSALPALSPAT